MSSRWQLVSENGGYWYILWHAAWEELLAEGRVATLSSWLNRADELHARSPMIDFVEAEVAWREGAYERAERLALAAADSLGPQAPARDPGLLPGWLEPHLEAREEVAFEHQRLARETAATDHDLANALWEDSSPVFSSSDLTPVKFLKSLLRLARRLHRRLYEWPRVVSSWHAGEALAFTKMTSPPQTLLNE